MGFFYLNDLPLSLKSCNYFKRGIKSLWYDERMTSIRRGCHQKSKGKIETALGIF